MGRTQSKVGFRGQLGVRVKRTRPTIRQRVADLVNSMKRKVATK